MASGNSRSVITLQVGHYANFVGTHFWNCQDLSFASLQTGEKSSNDIDHDVLFREGQTLNSGEVTYTPRLVSIDLKGALGSLPEFGDLYHDAVGAAAISKTDLSAQSSKHWQHEVAVQKEETIRKSKYLKELQSDDHTDEDKDVNSSNEAAASSGKKLLCDLDSEVEIWSDYLRARYHPKTNVIVQEYQHNNVNQLFDVFGLGQTAFANGAYSLGEDVEDRVRFFAEESDNLKGFQLITDVNDGFGGKVSYHFMNLFPDFFQFQVCLRLFANT